MSREQIIIFDDGSLESKVMQYELKTSYDTNIVKVQPYTTLDAWLSQTEDENIQKIFLHFCFEDYQLKDIHGEIVIAHHKNPKLRVIAWYEQASRSSIEHRALNYGIKPDIKLTGKPEAIVVEEPQQTVKDIASDIIREVDKREGMDKPYFTEKPKKKDRRKNNPEYFGNA